MLDPAMLGGGAPPSIQIPGGDGGEPPAPDAGGGDPMKMMRDALEMTRKAAAAEPDDEDQALLEKIGADIAKYLAAQQKLTDSALGAGPGVKLVRKAAGNSGAGY